MGSCISKCKPKKTPNKQKPQEDCPCIEKNNPIPLIQDKLVITQASISSPSPSKNHTISPLSSSKSSSSPSFGRAKSNYPTTSSSSSSSSCSSLSSSSSFVSSTSSSILSSKLDRSFSNEFLWSCVKENPHLIRPDYPIKISIPKTRSSLPTRCHTSGNRLTGPKQQPPSPHRVTTPVAQKRPRCSSPIPSNLTRQKSLRREPDRPISRSSRELRPISPSPSRRFKGEVVTTSMRRDNGYVRPHSPSNVHSRRYGRSNNLLAKRENETSIKRVESKIEELALGNLLSGQDMDWMPIEDVNNPQIALDCFIFL